MSEQVTDPAWDLLEEIEFTEWMQDPSLQKEYEFEETTCGDCKEVIGGYLDVPFNSDTGVEKSFFDSIWIVLADAERLPYCESCAYERAQRQA